MVTLKNVNLLRLNLKTNYNYKLHIGKQICTIKSFLVVTVKMLYMYFFAIIAIFSILGKLKNQNKLQEKINQI